MGDTSKDLLELERKNSSSSAIESALLVCENKRSSSLSGPPIPDLRPVIASVPKSQVLGRVKDFLGIMAEANRKLELEAKDNSEAFDIEAITGNESEVIEMDLMLGIADLHTPEAVSAAEAAIAGNQSVIASAAGNSDSESEDSSDGSEDESDGDEENNGGISSQMETSKTGKDSSSGESSKGKERSRKRPKIIELS